MNELTEKEKEFSAFVYLKNKGGLNFHRLDLCELFFDGAWDLQQSRIDELVKALEKIKIRNSAEMKEYGECENNYAISEIVSEALEKHKKYKEGWE
jgi:hypothetical protein